jgi:hypothetical protein
MAPGGGELKMGDFSTGASSVIKQGVLQLPGW